MNDFKDLIESVIWDMCYPCDHEIIDIPEEEVVDLSDGVDPKALTR